MKNKEEIYEFRINYKDTNYFVSVEHKQEMKEKLVFELKSIKSDEDYAIELNDLDNEFVQSIHKQIFSY